MTPEEQAYVNWASERSCHEWTMIRLDKVQSEEAKEALNRICIRLNHLEEAAAGNI